MNKKTIIHDEENKTILFKWEASADEIFSEKFKEIIRDIIGQTVAYDIVSRKGEISIEKVIESIFETASKSVLSGLSDIILKFLKDFAGQGLNDFLKNLKPYYDQLSEKDN